MKNRSFLTKSRLVLAAVVALSVYLVWKNVASCFPVYDGKPLGADASSLPDTFVTGHLDVPIKPGENVLWCGSFQLAYNEIEPLVGAPVSFEPSSDFTRAMDKKAFTKKDLDTESYVALAGFVRDNIHDRIRKEVDNKFQGRVTPRAIPDKALTKRPQDIVAYCLLYKNLEFPIPFERLEKPLDFEGAGVPSFGIGEETKPDHGKLVPQVRILDYLSEDDFVIELKTKSEGDRLILAKVPPQETLAETVRSVEKRASAEGEDALIGDILQVPKFDFDVTRRYSELETKHLVTSNPTIAKDLEVLSALQSTLFQMNEKGVKLVSESHIAIGCSAHRRPEHNHTMIFDKPFLIMMKRAGAETPYFALWVANTELMLKP